MEYLIDMLAGATSQPVSEFFREGGAYAAGAIFGFLAMAGCGIIFATRKLARVNAANANISYRCNDYSSQLERELSKLEEED